MNFTPKLNCVYIINCKFALIFSIINIQKKNEQNAETITLYIYLIKVYDTTWTASDSQ